MSEGKISLAEILSDLPPLVLRRRVSELTGGAISAKTMANMDSLGQGPARRVKLGRNVAYVREDFVAWLESRSR